MSLVIENITEKEDGIKASVKGACTIRTASNFFKEIKTLWDKNRNLALDFSQVSEMDSSAYQILILFKREASKSKRIFRLINHSDATLRIIDIYGSIGIFSDKVQIDSETRARHNLKYGLKKMDGYF